MHEQEHEQEEDAYTLYKLNVTTNYKFMEEIKIHLQICLIPGSDFTP